MWGKVDDRFTDHKKVFAAGEHLGPYATGRVIAIWVEALCWTNKPENATNGFIPIGVMRTFKHDRQPLKVAEAMSQTVPYADGSVHSGLFEKCDGGYQLHDYGVYNDREKFEQTSAARAEAGRRGGLKSGEARRQAKSKQTTKQLLQANDSNDVANGKQNRTPFPDPEDLQVQEHRAEDVAECAQPVENDPEPDHKLLCALVRAEWRAMAKKGREFEDETDLSEHMKGAAAQAHVAYDGPSIAIAIRAVAGSNGRRLS
jgi:hypothetical protein